MRLFIEITIFTIMIPLSFWMGVHSREKIIMYFRVDLIQSQEAHKESLREQALFLEVLNDAFDKTVEEVKE